MNTKKFRAPVNGSFRLADYSTSHKGSPSKEEARALLEKNRSRMHLMQEKLYAQDSWGLLIILQAMDAAGKDSLIEHVMSGVNPQGCEVHSFKRPSDEELDHDFLWRTTRRLPERGRIGIFNRSYYEEMLVVRVHPEFLARQRLPAAVVTKNIWRDRAEDINAFERYLTRNGIAVLKFFLYVSREEQRRRFLARIEEPEKNWKFAPADVEERGFWDDYMRAYNDAIKRTSTSDAPWYVVPADQKWFSRLLVSEVIVERLEDMKLAFPRLDRKRRAELRRSRQQLLED
ncbi:MAG: polyphosphate kinase 2 family protein [Acidobacteria bacterium]|nr:polyphosphate kinase 2 family protein [Acidobacteriota bacterium]